MTKSAKTQKSKAAPSAADKRPTPAEIEAELLKTPGLIGDFRRFVAETGGINLDPYLPKRRKHRL